MSRAQTKRAEPGTNSRIRSTLDHCVSTAQQQDSALGPAGGAGRDFEPLDVAAAWAAARAAAEFAGLIGVRCAEEGHSHEECSIRRGADRMARRSLGVARALAGSAAAA
ncbi:MAG TPA: hypothetical protein VMV09_09325 [Candidatus Saccharimonadales bacterium]|nr:hypothetical protein [Candidatus Saccharimonadales bacterium]